MDEYIDLPVLLESVNRIIILKVHPENVERARNDSQYLARLVSEQCNTDESVGQETTENNREYTPAASYSTGSQGGTMASEMETSVFIWTPPCVHLLLSLYEECENEFNSGNKRHKKIWEQISMLMEQHGYKVSWGQCQSKLNSLKKTFKKILDHNHVSGNDRMTWPYYERMNEIFGASSWVQPKALATEAGPSQITPGPSNNSEPKTKRRRLNIVQEETAKIKKEWQEKKLKKIDEFMAQKERQHKEKLEMMHAFIQAINEKKKD